MHVQSIQLSYVIVSGQYQVRARVMIRDQGGNIVDGATVKGTWTLPDGSHIKRKANTNLKGIAIVRVKSTQTGTYQICVTDVTKPGFVYDASQNLETCDTLVVSP